MANNFLPFCPTDTGTNLDSQSDYAAAADRTNGNQPGVARSKLVNKALRQATYLAGQTAQFVADTTGTDLLDDATPARLLAQLNAAMKRLAPVVTVYTTPTTANHNLTYTFFIATGSATVGATYTNNGVTYTVKATVASAVQVQMSGNSAPTASGTLTKATGTGDATLTFYANRFPLAITVKMTGAGGGGASKDGSPQAGSSGGNTTFGTSLLVAQGGGGGAVAGSGGGAGTASLGTGPLGIAVSGTGGSPASANLGLAGGGAGGDSPFGGRGTGGTQGIQNATSAKANTGSGGGGAHSATGSGAGGGAAGAYVEATITSPLSTYGYTLGGKGAGGAGAGAVAGGDGADAILMVIEYYQ